MIPEDRSEAQRLVDAVSRNFGERVQVEVVPYSQLFSLAVKDQGQVWATIKDEVPKERRITGIL